ncbi:hypothetical protein [Streptomyces sp. NPDC059071]|uniref:hypothetical protein n=1 Tax=unclassified Streptomyces TaxID=2593676 RepID=UPI00364B52D2
MTSADGTTLASSKKSRLAWATIAAGLVSIAAVVVLGLTGHAAAATAVGAVGAAMCAAGGVTITVNIRK